MSRDVIIESTTTEGGKNFPLEASLNPEHVSMLCTTVSLVPTSRVLLVLLSCALPDLSSQ